MRWLGSILMVLLVAGCAARAVRPQTERIVEAGQREEPVSEALVFAPTDLPQVLILPRDERQRQAFIGYDELSTSFYLVRTIDRQTNDWTDRYERKAIIERAGVSFR